MADSAGRAVVSDDGTTISLAIYGEAGEPASVAVAPTHAIALAGKLIQAALPKLSAPLEKKPARRGGDPKAGQRRRRDDAIRAVAPLIANGVSTERQAREITQRLARYRPMPNETLPERRLLREISDTGLPVGRRRIREILAKQ